MSLKERRDLVALAADRGGAGTNGTLITLTAAAGSSYRAAGARLLVMADGRTAGSISGGCLEADLLRKAEWMTRNGAAMQSYDTSFDETAEVPYGLGCGGEVKLLLEPLGTPEADAVLQAMHSTLAGAGRRLATLLPAPEQGRRLARIVLDDARDVVFASAHLRTEDVVELRSRLLCSGVGAGLRDAKRPRLAATTADGLYCEQMLPAQRLVIFGAGDDSKPLVRIAAQMGWTVIVADGRAQMARAERFAEAQQVHVLQEGEALPAQRDDAVVVMTHSYEQDRSLLTKLLQLSPRYLGLLGARHRSALLLQEAGEQIGMTLEEAAARVFAPVGMAFGSDGPEAIALSVAAQIQAELEGVPTAGRRMLPADAALQIAGEQPLRIDVACALRQ